MDPYTMSTSNVVSGHDSLDLTTRRCAVAMPTSADAYGFDLLRAPVSKTSAPVATTNNTSSSMVTVEFGKYDPSQFAPSIADFFLSNHALEGLGSLEQATSSCVSAGEPRIYDAAQWFIESTHFIINRPASHADEVKLKFAALAANMNVEVEDVSYDRYKMKCITVCDQTLRGLVFMVQILQTADKSKLIIEFQRRDGDHIFFSHNYTNMRTAMLATEDNSNYYTLESDIAIPTDMTSPRSLVAPLPLPDMMEVEMSAEEAAETAARQAEQWDVLRCYLESCPQEGIRLVGSLMNNGVAAPRTLINTILGYKLDITLKVMIVQVLTAYANQHDADMTGMADVIEHFIGICQREHTCTAAGGHKSSLVFERQLCRLLEVVADKHLSVIADNDIILDFVTQVVTNTLWAHTSKIATAVLELI